MAKFVFSAPDNGGFHQQAISHGLDQSKLTCGAISSFNDLRKILALAEVLVLEHDAGAEVELSGDA